jgi:hypothetical protein
MTLDRSTDELLLRRLHDALEELREIHLDLGRKFGLFPEFSVPSERLGRLTFDLSDLWLGRDRLNNQES